MRFNKLFIGEGDGASHGFPFLPLRSLVFLVGVRRLCFALWRDVLPSVPSRALPWLSWFLRLGLGVGRIRLHGATLQCVSVRHCSVTSTIARYCWNFVFCRLLRRGSPLHILNSVLGFRFGCRCPRLLLHCWRNCDGRFVFNVHRLALAFLVALFGSSCAVGCALLRPLRLRQLGISGESVGFTLELFLIEFLLLIVLLIFDFRQVLLRNGPFGTRAACFLSWSCEAPLPPARNQFIILRCGVRTETSALEIGRMLSFVAKAIGRALVPISLLKSNLR